MTGAGALAVFPTLLGCAAAPTKHDKDTSSAEGPITSAAGTVVMVIRHAEKPAKSGAGGAGIALTGASDPHSLTERGWTPGR